jgi:hypothetical protein
LVHTSALERRCSRSVIVQRVTKREVDGVGRAAYRGLGRQDAGGFETTARVVGQNHCAAPGLHGGARMKAQESN